MRNKLILVPMALAMMSVFFSCDKQDDTYAQYVVKGGYNYPAKPAEVSARSGYYKVQVSWAVPRDPAVKSVRLYWDNYADSMSVDYASAVDGMVDALVDKLEERAYTFNVVNFDSNGNKSLSAEITVSPYGDGWLSTHAERKVNSAMMKGDSALVSLGNPIDEMVLTKFRYKNNAGQLVESEPVPADSVRAWLPDALKGKYFEYQSAYCPNNGLDIVWSENWIRVGMPILYNLASPDWAVDVTTKQYRDNSYLPDMMFDRDLETMYYSSTNTTIRRNFPKTVTVDTKMPDDKLPTVVSVNVIQHPDQSKSRYIKGVNVYVGDSPYDPNDSKYADNFGDPAGEFVLTQDDAEQLKNLKTPVSGRYYAIVFKSSYSTSGFISAYEFEFLGYVESEAE